MNKFYVTTPIYYVNARPHLGHTYTTLAADVLARYHRMIGDNTFFSTGTDEHGTKIEQKAKEEGKKPREYVDEVAALYKMAWDEMNVSNNEFIRTTDENHIDAVRNALRYMYAKGDIVKDKYEGWYCVGCEQFKNEKDLVDEKCPDHLTKPEWTSEDTYVFKMSKYAEKLQGMIERDELKIRPLERKNEILSFYEREGLNDISFSRVNVKWGIPLPWDEAHTAYVWSDAFLNYLTILGWAGDGPTLEGEAKKLWPPDVQLMSKDILRVHSTIWPAMLLSLDLPVQHSIFVHGFFLFDSQKMSKSLGNVIAPEVPKNKYGVDATRYLLFSATTFGRDGDISWEKFDEKYTADLANGIGNLVARSISLAKKLNDAKIDLPIAPSGRDSFHGEEFDHDITHAWNLYQRHLIDVGLDKALEVALKEVRFLDGFISAAKPWELIKDKHPQAGSTLYRILERLRHIALMLWPFLPETSELIWQRLGLKPHLVLERDFNKLILWGGLPANTKIKVGDPLFPRIN
jgi:methionyl-tRNA synthetase